VGDGDPPQTPPTGAVVTTGRLRGLCTGIITFNSLFARAPYSEILLLIPPGEQIEISPRHSLGVSVRGSRHSSGRRSNPASLR
jgi:hypothetical protein